MTLETSPQVALETTASREGIRAFSFSEKVQEIFEIPLFVFCADHIATRTVLKESKNKKFSFSLMNIDKMQNVC
jgi:hypothetical protein